VSNCEEVGWSDVWSDGDVGSEVEMDWQWQEFIEVEQIGIGDHWYMQNEHKFNGGWCVEV
jgi:hypothetical protein